MAELAAVGWALGIAGWVASPITSRLLNSGFALLGFDESDKLRDLETRVLPEMALMLMQAERIPPGDRVWLEGWAKRLRSAFYDAEDILDVADFHRLENMVICRSAIELKLDRIKHIISGKTSELKKVLKKLENIIEEGHRLLQPLASTINNGSYKVNPATREVGIVTTSLPVTEVIFGRDKERDDIINMLRKTLGEGEPSSSNTRCYSTIGIYGVGGSGKTTLAQYVCDYERTQGYFSPVMWIPISQSFDVQRIRKEMLEAATVNKPPHDYSNHDTLQTKLKEEMRGKRFLLVLDDIWPENHVNVQDQLLPPLKDEKRGSMVLVTTRFEGVATSLCAHNGLIPISDLKEENFFNLLMHYALDGVSLDNQQGQETFCTIGREIVKKLKGSPLAARLVGARLRRQLNPDFWRRVGNQDLLTGTMDALWWSYQYLDAPVRRCFAYFSMFPEGHIFRRDELVDLWMAEGFLNPTNSDEQMEDIGHNYFDELVSCSFLQARRGTGYFIMHDLIHELAGMIAGDDCSRVEEGKLKEIHPDVRYLFIKLDDPMKVAELIRRLKKLRTLKFTSSDSVITVDALEGILKKLKKLRVVQVHLQGVELLIPACICDLKHLRCLSICSPRSRKVIFPRKFGRLYHLQILENRFAASHALEFSDVENMSNLISLQDIRGSTNTGFPGVGELKSLRELSNFIVRNEKGYELKQLDGLNQLRGRLEISGLENVESKERALEAKLTDKKHHLTSLSLEWEQTCSPPPDLQFEVMEGLCPPSQLTYLGIRQYGGLNYPSWLSQSQNCPIRSLKWLELSKCQNLEALPELGELFIHLDRLILDDLPKLKRFPRLPYSLKILEISRCWALVVTCIEDVEMIRSMVMERASRIEPSLQIKHPDEKIPRFADEQPDKFMSILGELVGTGRSNLEMIRNLAPFISGWMEEEDYPQMFLPASLWSLHIESCPITNTALHNCLRRCSTSLTTLNLAEIPFLRAIPSEVMKPLTGLSRLHIANCLHLTHFHGLNYLCSLDRLGVINCPNMTIQEADKLQFVPNLLVIDDMPMVPQLLSTEACSSLWSLTIQDSVELRGQEILQQLTSLKFLVFYNCKWNSLPENLANLTRLQELMLHGCKNIRSLPILPMSLRFFQLDDCDQVFMKSCQTAGDPNWQRIAHVPRKEFSMRAQGQFGNWWNSCAKFSPSCPIIVEHKLL